MEVYWFNLDISFSSPLIVLDENEAPTDEVVYGAFCEVGVTDYSEQEALCRALAFIDEKLRNFAKSQYAVNIDRVGVLDEYTMQQEIFGDSDIRESLLQNPSEQGIWYTTGFCFYTDDNYHLKSGGTCLHRTLLRCYPEYPEHPC